MNRVVLSGRLTADPVIRHTQDGKAVASYTLAVDRHVAKNAEGHTEADFIRITAWEKRAEFAEKYMKKGRRFVVAGRIQTGSYTDNDGKKVFTTDVIAEEQEFADSKPDAKQEPAQETQELTTEFMDIPEGIQEELPFN